MCLWLLFIPTQEISQHQESKCYLDHRMMDIPRHNWNKSQVQCFKVKKISGGKSCWAIVLLITTEINHSPKDSQVRIFELRWSSKMFPELSFPTPIHCTDGNVCATKSRSQSKNMVKRGLEPRSPEYQPIPTLYQILTRAAETASRKLSK